MKKGNVHFIFILIISLYSHFLLAQNSEKTNTRPYIVQKKDTVWDLSKRFLKHPWDWDKAWKNGSVQNPKFIYPGDAIEVYENQNTVTLKCHPAYMQVLRPNMHVSANPIPIAPLPLENIRPFLDKSLVFSADELPLAPTVIAIHEDKMVGSTGDFFFAKGLQGQINDVFNIYRDLGEYRRPKSREIIGYQADFIGKARMIRPGDPATLNIIEAEEEIKTGDKLLQIIPETTLLAFMPHTPMQPIYGTIIDVMGGYSVTGDHSVLVMDRGSAQGVTPGDVLAIAEEGKSVIDPIEGKHYIDLPNDHIGEAMVFRVFENVSFALVMRTIAPIQQGDLLVNPESLLFLK